MMAGSLPARLPIAGPAVLVALACGGSGSDPAPAPGDTTAPTIVHLAPSPGARDVAQDAPVTVRFSEPINPSTVGPGSFLVRLGDEPVPGAYLLRDSVATFVADDEFVAQGIYGVRVTRGIRDPSGNQLARDTAWSFGVGTGIPRSTGPR